MDGTAARNAAEERLNSQAGFRKMVGGFLILIVVLIVIRALTGQDYLWPAWAMLGVGVATASSAWSAYGPRPKSPSQAVIGKWAEKFG